MDAQTTGTSPLHKLVYILFMYLWRETIKARGLILIDYELPGGFVDAAEEQKRLQETMDNLTRGNNRVTYFQCDIKERRGDGKPDIKKLKIRTG